MHLSTLLPVFLSSLSLTSAAALDQAATWKVTNYAHSCHGGGCAWHFDISARDTRNARGFSTYCQGDSTEPTACDLQNITTTITPLENPWWKVHIERNWTHFPENEPPHFDLQQASKNVTDETTSFDLQIQALGVSKRGN